MIFDNIIDRLSDFFTIFENGPIERGVVPFYYVPSSTSIQFPQLSHVLFGRDNTNGELKSPLYEYFEKSSKDFVSGLNPNIEGNNNNQRKVVRGGSWKDVAHFLKVSSRDYELQNKKRSYIGFRTVQSYMGEDVGFQENPNKIF